MNTNSKFALSLTLALAAAFPVLANDDARLGRVAVGADARSVEWACGRAGAPSFTEMEQLGIKRDSRQYRQRLRLAGMIRSNCAEHGPDTILVLIPADSAPAEVVAVR